MDTHNLFSSFDSEIQLGSSKIKKLKSNRSALRNKIRHHFKENKWDIPKFSSQGSFQLNTNLNPIKKQTDDGDIKEEYDLDDGVYFICPKSERKEAVTYHDRIKEAVAGHADNVVDKKTCVRVMYADGHNIDLPSYWLEEDGDTPELAHKTKGFTESDPKAFKDWVDGEISKANSNGQLRRIIRYLKAWKDYQEDENSSLKLPSGFILTILACQKFVQDDRDDLALKNTAEAIKEMLNSNFTCYRPTVSTTEELLDNYSKNTVLDNLTRLVDNAQKAIGSDCPKEASELWRKVFGDRFPRGRGDKSTSSNCNKPTRTKVNAPWLSY